jgi:hypothetical protein
VITSWQNIAEMKATSDGADGMVAVSTDDGKTFGEARAVLPDNDVCPCCQLTLSFDAESNAYMGVRKIFEDGRDSIVAKSGDGGQTFELAGRLDLGRWDIDGCPLKPTELAIHGERVFAAAFTGGEDPAGLYFNVSNDGGATFGGKLQIHPGAAYSDAPALTADADGTARIVWHASVGGARRLYTSVSTDGGASLTPPVEIATPAGASMLPASAVADDGTVFVTWQQENEEVFVIGLPAPAADMASAR